MRIEVVPHVWISSKGVLDDSNFISQKNIKAIINLMNDLSFLDRKMEYNDIVRNNVEKYNIIKTSQYLDSATLFINKKVKMSQSVIIVCENGYFKSPVLLLAYLIRYSSLSKQVSLGMLRTKILDACKPNIFGEEGLNHFIKSLK